MTSTAGGQRPNFKHLHAARTILSGAATQLLLEEGDAAGASKIEAALKLTAVAPARDTGLFADQLQHLHRALTDPALAPAAAERGGPEAAVDLAATAATLRAADQGRTDGRGTPVATERLDLLDGIAVTLARRALRARPYPDALAVEDHCEHMHRRGAGRVQLGRVALFPDLGERLGQCSLRRLS